MKNQIVLYGEQIVDCFVYSSQKLTSTEEESFRDSQNLSWKDFPNAKIICNFTGNLASSYFSDVTNKVTGYQILKQRPQDNFAQPLGIFSAAELEELNPDETSYYIVDYNVKNNNEYTYFISPLTDKHIHTTLQTKVITDWEVFSLTPIYKTEGNKYQVVKDEFGHNINWIFQLNCSEGDITLNQDKTIFTNFSSKPKISMGELHYHSGDFSCLLGNTLYNDQYYEPNVLLDLWSKIIRQNHMYLFKNTKGDSMVVSLEDGTKRKYMNEVANYSIDKYNMNTAITNRPTTIEFSYIEVVDADDIIVCGD